MRVLGLLLVILTSCAQSLDPDGIYQYTITGDIEPSGSYCGSGTIDSSAQVQVAGFDGKMSAAANATCIPTPCDLTPCSHSLNFDCAFSQNGDVTCTPQIDSGNPVSNVFALGTCTSSSCSLTAPTIADVYTNIDIEMTRQR